LFLLLLLFRLVILLLLLLPAFCLFTRFPAKDSPPARTISECGNDRRNRRMSDGAWYERTIRDAILAGDADAWRFWFDAHFDRLAGYVCWRCGGLRDLTDDVLQETWLVAVRRLSNFDPAKGAFFDWLCGIASNAARSAIRTRGRQKTRARSLIPGDDKAAADTTDGIERAERVAAALAALPDHYESVLRAKYFDRLSVDAIAASRGESPKAVESLLSRARQAFREIYEKTDV
jgi:RNA polymerase sigma-70 factor (ECF subfamily)